MRAHPATTALLACTFALAGGCGDASTSSSLEVTQADGGDGLHLEALWTYRSSEVDVDIRLLTVEGEQACTTSGRLRVDRALSGTDLYRMPETACDDVRITLGGDLVLFAAPTGHNWAAEAIDVDTDRELIRLGPWHDEPSGITYRFTLSSPACDDIPSCDCPHLDRDANGELLSLPLGRTCD